MPQVDPNAGLLPVLVEHASMINEMDDAVNQQYMFGESGTTSWVSPWQPTEMLVVDRAIALGQISQHDTVLDLGCGDGRVLLRMASMTHCQTLGWDCAVEAVNCAERLSIASNLSSRCRFDVVDFTLPLSEENRQRLSSCTVVFVYLVHYGLEKIKPLLADLLAAGNPNVRLVTNTYHFPEDFGWKVIRRDDQDVIRILQPNHY